LEQRSRKPKATGRFQVKAIVQKVKALAREYAERLGNQAFLREIDRAFEREERTVQKRLATGAARQERQGPPPVCFSTPHRVW